MPEYYTFAQMIYTLKKQYQLFQILFDNMADDIKVLDSKELYTTNFLLQFKNRHSQPEIILIVSKTLNRIDELIDYYLTKKTKSFSPWWYKNHAKFKLVDDNGKCQFQKEEEIYTKNQYQPKVIIPNYYQDELNNLYQKMQKLPFYSLPNTYLCLNPNEYLSINGSEITLIHYQLKISYNFQDNCIHISSPKRYTSLDIEQLLQTEIPQILLPIEYVESLNNADNDLETSVVYDAIGRRKETLFIDDTEKRLALKRK